jgi:hypothetical protein
MLAMIAGLHSPRRKPQVNAMDQVFGTYTKVARSRVPYTTRRSTEPPMPGGAERGSTSTAGSTAPGIVSRQE